MSSAPEATRTFRPSLTTLRTRVDVKLSNDQMTNNKSQSSAPYAQNPDLYVYGAEVGSTSRRDCSRSRALLSTATVLRLRRRMCLPDVSQGAFGIRPLPTTRLRRAEGVTATRASWIASNVTVANNTATAATEGNCWLPLGVGASMDLTAQSCLQLLHHRRKHCPAAGPGISFEDGSRARSCRHDRRQEHQLLHRRGVGLLTPSEEPIVPRAAGTSRVTPRAASPNRQTSSRSILSWTTCQQRWTCTHTAPGQVLSGRRRRWNGAACPATDERGITRPQGKACDIGAVELFVPPAGYWVVGSDGGVFAFGGAGFFGSAGGPGLNAPAVGIAPTPDGGGYWVASSNGGVVAFGDAGNFGNLQGTVLNAPVVGIAGTPDGQGYWLAGADGGIFAFGDAAFYGSTGKLTLNQPIVGIATTPDGGGYWEVASDGGIFSFGDATFYGSTGSLTLNQPVVGMAPTPDGGGYWLVAADGGIFSFGDAAFYGSTGSLTLNQPIVGMAVTSTGTVTTWWLKTAASSPSVMRPSKDRFQAWVSTSPTSQGSLPPSSWQPS